MKVTSLDQSTLSLTHTHPSSLSLSPPSSLCSAPRSPSTSHATPSHSRSTLFLHSHSPHSPALPTAQLPTNALSSTPGSTRVFLLVVPWPSCIHTQTPTTACYFCRTPLPSANHSYRGYNDYPSVGYSVAQNQLHAPKRQRNDCATSRPQPPYPQSRRPQLRQPQHHPNKSALPNGLKRAPNAHNTADFRGARLFPALESTLNDYMRGGSAIEG